MSNQAMASNQSGHAPSCKGAYVSSPWLDDAVSEFRERCKAKLPGPGETEAACPSRLAITAVGRAEDRPR